MSVCSLTDFRWTYSTVDCTHTFMFNPQKTNKSPPVLPRFLGCLHVSKKILCRLNKVLHKSYLFFWTFLFTLDSDFSDRPRSYLLMRERNVRCSTEQFLSLTILKTPFFSGYGSDVVNGLVLHRPLDPVERFST